MNEDGPILRERTDNLFFFLGSFGFLAFLVGSGIIVAAAIL